MVDKSKSLSPVLLRLNRNIKLRKRHVRVSEIYVQLFPVGYIYHVKENLLMKTHGGGGGKIWLIKIGGENNIRLNYTVGATAVGWCKINFFWLWKSRLSKKL